MKHGKVLVIDDELEEGYAYQLVEFLKIEGYEVFTEKEPNKGIAAAKNDMNLIFIDYQFSGSPDVITGADVGREIRKNKPLVPLILMTAYADDVDRIQEFISVGFDSLLPKSKEGWTKEDRLISKTYAIATAKKNAQKRLKTEFSENELLRVKERLDCIESALAFCSTLQEIAIAVSLMEHITYKDTTKTTFDKISNIDKSLIDSALAHSNSEDKAKPFQITQQSENKGRIVNVNHVVKLKTNSTLSTYFKVITTQEEEDEKGEIEKIKKFTPTITALKARYLLLKYPDNWQKTRTEYSTLKIMMKQFDMK
jgi:CheY-like chemotaxis protein